MFRMRFKKEILAEFLPPARQTKKQKVIILCDGMPSTPRKQPLVEFLASKGYWVFYPRYRGAWESGGTFLQKSPHQDVLDIISELPKGVQDVRYGKKFALKPQEIFVIGGSFGGAAALMASLDPRVKKVIANCPVVDWSVLRHCEKAETSKKNYLDYIHGAYGDSYRITQKNWSKLRTGKFYNPAYHANEITPSKVMMFHAKDDPYIPWSVVGRFAKKTGVTLKTLSRGGHLNTNFIIRKYWRQIKGFFEA